MVPADKASNNVIVVCKKYYLEVVLREVNAYECVTEEYGDLVDGHSKYMATNHMVVQPEFKCLPLFFWLPKLHKNPYGARFINAPLSKLLTSCLKLITNHFWRAGASQPSRTTGTIFLYLDLYGRRFQINAT